MLCMCLLVFPPSPSFSWYFFCRSWRKRLLKCLQKLSASKMQRRGKRQTIILGSRPGKWEKMGIPLFTKSLSWCWENKNNYGIWITTRTGKWSQEYPSVLWDFSLFLDSQTPVLEISELPCEWIETWPFILSLTCRLLCVCSKLSQRDKLLSLGRKKFNVDPAKVGFALSQSSDISTYSLHESMFRFVFLSDLGLRPQRHLSLWHCAMLCRNTWTSSDPKPA